ncbi:MAG: Phospholipase D-nuclease N-terminal [Planctomycetota bacterium]|jgi:hypothetical protein
MLLMNLGIEELGVLFLLVFPTIFWLYMLVQCIKNPRLKDSEKAFWILIILFLNVVGAILYYFVGDRNSA